MELENLLDLFKFLSSPFNDGSAEKAIGETNSPQDVFKNIASICLKDIDYLESSKPLLNPTETLESTSSWKLTCLILSMLHKLKIAIEEKETVQPENEKCIEVLSIQSQIFVQKSVELVIGFGIVPYLLPGLGVPTKLRKMNPSVSNFLLEAKSASPFDQFMRLGHTLDILLHCSSHPSLNALIVPKYSSDILAGLLQICRSPIARPKIYNLNECKPVGALSLEQYETAMKVREKVSNAMTQVFFANIPKTLLINSLFLIGATEKPRWISASCNDYLCDIILSKNGLLAVATTMLDVAGSSDSWKLMRVVSSLMRNALMKAGSSSTHAMLSNLAEQCLQMVAQHSGEEHKTQTHENLCNYKQDLESGHKSASMKLPYGSNVEIMRIGLYCGIALMDVDFQFGKSVFWDRLFYHVVLLDTSQNQENLNGGNVSIIKDEIFAPSMKEISSCFENVAVSVVYVELLLSLLKPLNASLPLKSLQPVWSVYVQIFVACERYLKKPVQEPNVAAAAEQLHHKLKDVLILLVEIYGSSAGENLVLPGGTGNPGTGAKSANTSSTSKSNANALAKEDVNLCDLIMILLLNQESHGVSTLNTFDLLCDAGAEVQIVRTRQEIISTLSDYNDVYEKYLDGACTCLSTEIFKSERLKGIWPTLFRQLLMWGTKRHNQKSPDRQRQLKIDELPTLLDCANAKICLSDCQRFIIFKLLGELGDEDKIMEELGNSESMHETLSFLELLLNKFTNEVCSDQDDAFDSSQLIIYALGIIGALIETAATSVASMACQFGNSNNQSSSVINKKINELWEDLEIFSPHLRKLSRCTQLHLTRQGIPEMASGLLLNIGTRGESRKSKNEFMLKTRYQQALEDVSSPMVHVKGHGILELRRLIEQKDTETLGNEVQVLKLFQENLRNEDSYIYLMSIQGISALASKFHKTVVPLLIKEYDFINCDSKSDHESESSSADYSTHRKFHKDLDSRSERIETRMKVGEILVKVVQRLNVLAPSYRVPLTNVFFRLMRDEEPLIRASALSNLGELCHLLKFSLGVILTEVWFCVESILSTEKDIHVRRAALHLLVLLLRGVQDLTVSDILSESEISRHLRDARRLLTRIEQSEGDLVSKTHCQLALQELELIIKKLLTPTHSLQYKIQVLNI